MANSWTNAIAMEREVPQTFNGKFLKDPDDQGWWEYYSPSSWSDLANGRMKSALLGFRLTSPGNSNETDLFRPTPDLET